MKPKRAILITATGVLFVAVILFLGYWALSQPKCLVEGTRVDTPTGSCPVESLATGDEVWSLSPDGRLASGRVVRVERAWTMGYLEITAEGHILRVTKTHPIATPHGWVEAGRLRPGDAIVTRNGARSIDSIRSQWRPAKVYDLEIEPHSNFFAESVLVHNKSSNFRNASGTLKTLGTAEADFRSNDRDGNGVNDFWIADVRGLWFILGEEEREIKLIEISAAMADWAPRVDFGDTNYGRDVFERGPKSGYWYVALSYYEDESGRRLPYDDGTGRNRQRFGFLAFPSEHGVTGEESLILDEGNTMYRKDLEGKLLDTFPLDPLSQGWKKMD